ncbi:MAG: NUDIX domain-containing protein [Candidatus Aenigmatarchaeota archaeon]
MIQHDTVTLVIEKDGKFLLGKRLNSPEKGCWCTPGGHIDAGESPLEAAKREAAEEVGEVELEPKPLFDFIHDVRVGHRHHAYVFRGRPRGKIRAGSDIGEVGWFTLEQIAALDVAHYTNIIFNRMFPDASSRCD